MLILKLSVLIEFTICEDLHNVTIVVHLNFICSPNPASGGKRIYNTLYLVPTPHLFVYMYTRKFNPKFE